jgi:hypothetical protein
MDPITSAVIGYVVKAFSDNEEAKQFKTDIFGGFVKWVRPLFLVDDVASEAVLTSDEMPVATKEKVIAAKLPKLMEDEALRSEMEAWVSKLKAAGISGKSIVSGADVDVVGNIRVGDTNADAGQSGKHKRENIVENSKIKGGGDFRLGNDYK